jgi:uncharacterized protein (TIGR03437 family)
MPSRFVQPVRAAQSPLPTVLNGVSASITAGSTTYELPILGIEQFGQCTDDGPSECRITTLVVQVPYGIPASGGVEGSIQIKDNTTISAPFHIVIQLDTIHILRGCDFVLVGADHGERNCVPLVIHADGTLVSSSSPARVGETVSVYATGLGATYPSVPSGSPTPTPPPQIGDVTFTLAVVREFGINLGPSRPEVPNGSQRPQAATVTSFAGLAPGYAGLYQINIDIPDPGRFFRPCLGGALTNFTMSFGRFTSFDGVGICVVP